MSGERPTQFRLFQEDRNEVSRKDEQARRPDEKLRSRGRIEDKIGRDKSGKGLKKEIKETGQKLKEVDTKLAQSMHEGKRRYTQEAKWRDK